MPTVYAICALLILIVSLSVASLVRYRRSLEEPNSATRRRRRLPRCCTCAPGVFYRADNTPDRTVQQASGATDAYFGALARSTGWSLADLIHPEDRERVEEMVAEALRAGGEYHAEYRIRSDGDAWRWISDHGVAPALERGEAASVEGYLVDVTPRVEAEQERDRAAELYRLLSEHMTEVVMLHDHFGEVLYASPSCKAVLGYAPGELVERSCYVLMHPEDRDAVRKKIERRVIDDGESIFVQFRMRSKQGPYVPMRASCRPYRDGNGYQTGFVMALSNISALQRLRRELRRVKSNVADSLVMDREALRIMSHEIRTPLTGLMGFVEVLNEEVTGEHRRMLELVRASGHRILSTFGSILDFASLDNQPPDPNPAAADVVEVVAGELERYRSTAEENDLTIQLVRGADVIEAEVDTNHLARIVDRLISNAVKFTPDEGVITVSVFEIDDDVVVRVTDTGIGIAESFLPFVYEPFRQESTGLARDFEGVGIGLTIAKRLTEQIGGTISAESTKGKGSCFTIRFPRQPATSAAPDPAEPETSRDVAERTASPASQIKLTNEGPDMETRLRILVVDDNHPMRVLFRRHLESQFEVRTAGSAEQAIELARRTIYDVVILDLNLGPGKSGVDVMKDLRLLPGYENTDIIAVTAYALPEERSRFLRAGFDGYISKPFRRDTLLREISRLTMVPVELELSDGLEARSSRFSI